MLLNVLFFFSGVFDAGGCSYFSRFPPLRCPLQRRNRKQALQLDLRRVNEHNKNIVSRAIHVVISSLPKIGGVVCDMLLKAPHIGILDAKDILVSAVLLMLYAPLQLLYYCTRHGG